MLFVAVRSKAPVIEPEAITVMVVPMNDKFGETVTVCATLIVTAPGLAPGVHPQGVAPPLVDQTVVVLVQAPGVIVVKVCADAFSEKTE